MKREEREALIRGIRIAEVTRELPTFGPRNRSVSLEIGSCAQYSIPRDSGGAPKSWRLLQRAEAAGAELPNGYVAEPSLTELPAPLVDALRAIALEFPEDLFEFEATASEVSVFWEPHGGVGNVRRLHAHLERLAGL